MRAWVTRDVYPAQRKRNDPEGARVVGRHRQVPWDIEGCWRLRRLLSGQTEATSALSKWAFATLDLNRVQAETDTRNAASSRVLEELGFVREGTLQEDCVVDGDVSDSWVYGLLRRDWSEAALR